MRGIAGASDVLTVVLVSAVCLVSSLPTAAEETPWIRAGINAQGPIWGLQDGIEVALWPAGIGGGGPGGPRGLIRIGYPIGPERRHQLVNFIAIEPDVGDGNWRGLSELEPSDLDGVLGKRLTAEMPPGSATPPGQPGLPPGELDHPPDNPTAERLRILVRVERFRNGAHPYLVLTLRTDRPDEIMLEAFHEPDSGAMTMCVLTATMGNFARLRRAHLAEGKVVSAGQLWPRHTGHDFAPFRTVGLAKLARAKDGGVIVPLDCDEPHPAANWPHDPGIWWRWRWEKVTQYWRKPPGTFGKDLCFAANGRVEYWGDLPLTIPGGVAFENTELREGYRAGQVVCFGITREAPEALLGR